MSLYSLRRRTVAAVALALSAVAVAQPVAFDGARTLSLAGGTVLSLDTAGSRLLATGASGATKTIAVPGLSHATLFTMPNGEVWLEGLNPANATGGGKVVDSSSLTLGAADDAGLPTGPSVRYAVLANGKVASVSGTDGRVTVWDPATHQSVALPQMAPMPSLDRLTALRDGALVLETSDPLSPASQVLDPVSGAVRRLSVQEADELSSPTPLWTAASPLNEDADVLPGARIAIAFSKALDANTVNDATVVLFGPGGPVAARRTLVDDGRMLVVTPERELFTGTRYTVFLKGLRSAGGVGVPFGSYGFGTASIGAQASGHGRPSTASGGIVGQAGGITSSTSSADAATGGAQGPVRLSTGPSVNGVLKANDDCKPGSRAIVLCRAHSLIKDGAFYPGRDATVNKTGGHWRTYQVRLAPMGRPLKLQRNHHRPLVASRNAKGGSAVSGRILTIDGQPVGQVTVSVGSASTRTSGDGTFTLGGLAPGQQDLFVDGTSANRNGAEWGSFEVGVAVPSRGTLKLDYNMYLPRVLARDKVTIPSPTTVDLAITHPDIPGLEIDIPAGTVIHDHFGKVVTDLAIVPTPVDRAPFPTHNNYPVYFSILPGGAVIQNLSGKAQQGIQIKYPNYSHAPAGTVANFWNYDDQKGWQVYGKGHVSADGTQFVPDPGVALTTTIHGSFTLQSLLAGLFGNPDCGCQGGASASAADPVDLATGAFIHTWQDLGINDIQPLDLTRTYRSGDSSSRAFGVGMSSGFDWRLYDENSDYSQPKLIMPNLASLSFNPVLGDPALSNNDVLAVWKYTDRQGPFFGATLQHVEYTNNDFEEHWIIQTRTGMQYWFENEQENRLNQVVDRFGNATVFDLSSGLLDSVTSPSGRTISFTYDGDNRIVSAADNAGRTVGYVYNAAGYLGEVDYPDSTNEKYTYDTAGNLLTITDRRGHVVLTNQYTSGRVSQQTYADNTSFGFAYTVGTDGYSTQAATTEPNGALRVTQFDPATHYASSETYASGTALAQTTSYTRNAAGYITSTTDPLSRTTTMTYDDLGNLLTQTVLSGTADAATTTFTYTSDFNQIASIKDPLNHTTTFSYTNGCLTSITNPLGKSTTRVCNAYGQPTSVSDALGHGTQYGYIGYDLRTVTDALGHATTITVDGLGRTIAVADPLGNVKQVAYDVNDRVSQATDPRGKVISYGYDNDGNTLSVTMPGSRVIGYAWDNAGHLTTRTDALNQNESYTYDTLGNVQTVQDRNGQTTTFHYDALGRKDKVTFNDATTIDYGYDAGDRLTSITDSVSGTITRGYDGQDNLTSETTPQGTVTATFDAAGRRTGMTAAAQALASYMYDNANRLTAITQGSENVGFTYDDADRRTVLTLPNGVSTGYTYDNANELTNLAYAQAGGTSLGGIGYSYDAAGQILSQTGSLAVAADATPTTTGVFDANNRQTTFNGHVMSYDANGDLTGDGTNIYVWNARHQLVQIKQGTTVVASYAYDGTGRRISKQVGTSSPTTYLYDGVNIAQEMSGGTVNPILLGLGVDERFARSDSGARNYFLTNNLGSTVALTSAAGILLQQYQYDSYGNTSGGSGSSNPFQYTGRENDGNGLYFYRARYYNPTTGHFISEDPLGLLAGPNTYTYAEADPLYFIDPLGLAGIKVIKGIPPGSILFTLPNGETFYGPPGTDFSKVADAGASGGMFDSDAAAAAIGQFGQFDYQRGMGPDGPEFIPAYTDAANFGVGVYMYNAGFSWTQTMAIGEAYAMRHSSNAGSPEQMKWWQYGYAAAMHNKYNIPQICLPGK